jgi:cytochrome c oxidase cbb3-type subunit 3
MFMSRTKTKETAILVALFLVPGISLASGNAGQGKALYDRHGASCHGAGGKGDGAAAAALNPKPSNLSDKTAMAKLKDTDAFNVIKQGGAAIGKSPLMPPFAGALKDNEIHDLVAFVRSLSK